MTPVPDRPPLWMGSWKEVSSTVMALGSGLTIQSALDPEFIDSTLLERAVDRLVGPA